MDRIIIGLHKQILNRMRKSSVDQHVKASANDRLESVRSDLRTIYDEYGYENHITTYLKRESTKYHADDPDDHPYDGDRDEPLCLCNLSSCPVTNGRLPVEIQEADDIDSAIREYKHEHTADPVALEEAREAWHDLRGNVESVLVEVVIALSNNVPVDQIHDEPTDEDDVETEEHTEPDETVESDDEPATDTRESAPDPADVRA